MVVGIVYEGLRTLHLWFRPEQHFHVNL